MTHPDPRERNATQNHDAFEVARNIWGQIIRIGDKHVRLAGNIMANGLTVKHEVRLTEQDSSLIKKVAKARRCTVSQLFREALMEWLGRRTFLDEEEKKALGIAT